MSRHIVVDISNVGHHASAIHRRERSDSPYQTQSPCCINTGSLVGQIAMFYCKSKMNKKNYKRNPPTGSVLSKFLNMSFYVRKRALHLDHYQNPDLAKAVIALLYFYSAVLGIAIRSVGIVFRPQFATWVSFHCRWNPIEKSGSGLEVEGTSFNESRRVERLVQGSLGRVHMFGEEVGDELSTPVFHVAVDKMVAVLKTAAFKKADKAAAAKNAASGTPAEDGDDINAHSIQFQTRPHRIRYRVGNPLFQSRDSPFEFGAELASNDFVIVLVCPSLRILPLDYDALALRLTDFRYTPMTKAVDAVDIPQMYPFTMRPARPERRGRGSCLNGRRLDGLTGTRTKVLLFRSGSYESVTIAGAASSNKEPIDSRLGQGLGTCVTDVERGLNEDSGKGLPAVPSLLWTRVATALGCPYSSKRLRGEDNLHVAEQED
ncbi:hypothetical protein G7046_g4008 [Stylonectria norvegica]|nr:hypothetical protein G7046_g4008 [Stylonectria norvegica]